MFEVPKIVRSFGTVSGITEQPTGLDFGLSGDLIKSIQKGTGSGSGLKTITINPVDTTKSIAFLSVQTGNAPSANPRIQLTNATTVTVTNSSASIEWTVIEFKKIKSIQSGTATGASLCSSVISAVDGSKSNIFWSYFGSSSTLTYVTVVRFTSTTSIYFGFGEVLVVQFIGLLLNGNKEVIYGEYQLCTIKSK